MFATGCSIGPHSRALVVAAGSHDGARRPSPRCIIRWATSCCARASEPFSRRTAFCWRSWSRSFLPRRCGAARGLSIAASVCSRFPLRVTRGRNRRRRNVAGCRARRCRKRQGRGRRQSSVRLRRCRPFRGRLSFRPGRLRRRRSAARRTPARDPKSAREELGPSNLLRVVRSTGVRPRCGRVSRERLSHRPSRTFSISFRTPIISRRWRRSPAPRRARSAGWST